MIAEIKDNYKEIFIVFFATLLSMYIPILGNIRIFDFVSFLLLILLFKKNKQYIDKEILSFFLFFSLFIVFSFIVTIINQSDNIYLPRILGTFYTIIYSILFYSYFINKVNKLTVALKYSLYIHTFFFFIQYLSFFIGRTYIDFVKIITGHDSRNINGTFNLDTSLRFSGLYSEPAAYSLFILSLMSAYILYKKKINIIDIIILFTVPLSSSASGVIYLFAFLMIYFFVYSNFSFLKKSILSIFLIGILFFSDLSFINYDYLYNKISNFETNGSYQYRVGNMSENIESLPVFKQLFGVGYGNLDENLDAGSTFSSLFIGHGYILGGFFLLILSILLIKKHTKWYILLYIGLLFMGTHIFAQIQFWIWILSIVIISNYIYENERKTIQIIA